MLAFFSRITLQYKTSFIVEGTHSLVKSVILKGATVVPRYTGFPQKNSRYFRPSDIP